MLVDLPIAVFAAVEQHHRQAVAVLRAQRAITGFRRCVDIGGRQVETQLVGEARELQPRLRAQGAPGAGQQRHSMVHALQYPVT